MMAGTIAELQTVLRRQAGDDREGNALGEHDDRAGDPGQEIGFQRTPRDLRPPVEKKEDSP